MNLDYPGDKIRIDINRRLGRVFIPDPRRFLYVEISNICNLSCAFCGYSKKTAPRAIMSDEFFRDVIEQAVAMGYNRFGLTPITGDIFMDRHVFEKLVWLENHPKVREFHFYTNFILPDREGIHTLANLKKLSCMSISVYGHDTDSFSAMTRSRSSLYRRLVNNLQALCNIREQFGAALEIHWRTGRHFRPSLAHENDLAALIRKFRSEKGVRVTIPKYYNNWGGLVTPEDVEGLDISIALETDRYKNGACALVFYKQQVMADGRVNACACRDANATLCIGDLKQTSLNRILSSENEIYMELIEDQENGLFGPVCRSCDFYRSIYKSRRLSRRERMTVQEFRESITPSLDDDEDLLM